MASVNEILKRVRLKKDISSTEIEEILLNLNINEIASLCRTDKRFNTVCKRESFWRNKVTSQYGVDNPLPGKTWRDTARIFFQSDMINLGKEWVNGMTYKELIEEAYNRGPESLLYLKNIKNEKLEEILEMKIGSSQVLYVFSPDLAGDLEMSDEQLILEETVLTKELAVIAAAVAIRYFSYPELPGLVSKEELRNRSLLFAGYSGNMRKNTDVWSVNIDEMFEYIPYVMSYSSLNNEDLMNYTTSDVG